MRREPLPQGPTSPGKPRRSASPSPRPGAALLERKRALGLFAGRNREPARKGRGGVARARPRPRRRGRPERGGADATRHPPACVGRRARKLAAARSEPFWALRLRLRRPGTAKAAGIQRRHADEPLRGGGGAVALARGGDCARFPPQGRRPVQFAARAPDRPLARRRSRGFPPFRLHDERRGGPRHARLSGGLRPAGGHSDPEPGHGGDRVGRAAILPTRTSARSAACSSSIRGNGCWPTTSARRPPC